MRCSYTRQDKIILLQTQTSEFMLPLFRRFRTSIINTRQETNYDFFSNNILEKISRRTGMV